jgi:hypothetical protein
VHKRKSLRCALLFNEGRSGVPPIGLKMSREAVYRLQVILEGRFAAGPLGGNSGVRFQAHLISRRLAQGQSSFRMYPSQFCDGVPRPPGLVH